MANKKYIPHSWMIADNACEDKYKYSVLTMLPTGCKSVCDVYRWNHPGKKDTEDERGLINAKLIAAAPELLDNLIYCVKALEVTMLHNAKPIIERAKAAIAKATNN